MSCDAKLDACICNLIEHIVLIAFEWKDSKRENKEKQPSIVRSKKRVL